MASLARSPVHQKRLLLATLYRPGIRLGLCVAALGLGAISWGSPTPPQSPAWTEVLASPTFEANVGQFDGAYAARAVAGSAAIYIGHGGAVRVRTVRPARALSPDETHRDINANAWTDLLSRAPGMSLVGSSPDPEMVLEHPSSTRSHYYIGADPAKWHVNVPHFEQVRFRNVYPGIDQVFHAASRNVEFDFEVRPGADPQSIRLRLQAAGEVSVDANGDLALGIAGAQVTLKRPAVYQKRGDDVSQIGARYRIHTGGAVSIDVDAYDRSQALIVDPVLEYSTFVGGTRITGIAVDAEGAAYVAGTVSRELLDSADSDLSQVEIPVDYRSRDYGSGDNTFVLKIAPDGQHVAYIAVLGSRLNDRSAGIAVTAGKEAILGAVTQGTDYPMVKPLRNPLHDIEANAIYNVVTGLSADGASIRYSFYHSRRTDAAFESGRLDPLLAIDGHGRTVIATSGNLPGARAPRPPPTDTDYRCGGIIATRLQAAGDVEDVSLCLAATTLNGLAADRQGNIHLAGSTASAFFGHGAISTQIPNPAPTNTAVWISKIDLANAQVIHHTTWAGGGDGRDEARGVATDGDGNTYVAGVTTSPRFPIANARESGLTTQRLPKDLLNRRAAFVSKIDPSGTTILYSTFLNLDGDADLPPFLSGLFVDADRHAVVSGSLGTYATGSAVADNVTFQNAYIAKLSDSGDAVLYSYRLGGRYNEFDTVISAGRPHEIYVAGFTSSPDFPLQAPVQGWNGGVVSTNLFGTSVQTGTTFLARIIEDTPPITMTVMPTTNPTAVRSPVWVTAEIPAATGILAWYIDDQLFATQALTSGQRQIAFSPGALRRGTHVIRARYQPADDSVRPLDAEYVQSVDAPQDCP